jgi:hypothetical protein
MFARKALPVGTLFMVLIIAVAALGVGYGLWNEFLYIEGTVETGEVNAMFWLPDDYMEDNETPEKDTATCTAEVVDSGQDDDPDTDQLNVAIDTGYPSYECWITFGVVNNGNIPIHIYQPELDPVPDALTVAFDNCYDDDAQIHPAPSPLPDPFTPVYWPDTDPDTGSCRLYVHVEQSAEELQTGQDAYTFSAEIEARQFNETRCPNDCSGNGTCDQSTQYLCVCDAGWTGSDCSIAE